MANATKTMTLEVSESGRRSVAIIFFCFHIELVTHATHRVDQPGLEVVVDFCAQSTDGHIDHVGVGIKIHAPDLRGDQRTRQHLTLTAHQQFQQAEFLVAEIDFSAGARDSVPGQIQDKIGHPELIRQG